MGTSLVRVTHPFHPLSGRQLVCVGERNNWYGTRLLLRVDEDHVCSVPRQWTDVLVPDPEAVLGKGCALLRIADLLELADLVARLVEQGRESWDRKGKDAATVRPTVPRGDRMDGRSVSEAGSELLSATEPALDNRRKSGIIYMIFRSEIACRSETTERTRRPRPSSKRER